MSDNEITMEIRTDEEIDREDRARLEEGLTPLRRILDDFPVAHVHVDVAHHPRSKDLHLKLSLRLPKHTLFTGERDIVLYPAFEKCVRKMVHKVEAYKAKLRGRPERHKQQVGTAHEVHPAAEPDAELLTTAAERRDYVGFRDALDVYHESVMARASRMVNEFPEAAAALGEEITIEEIVEETFLHAFEGFLERPSMPLGQWLEQLIGSAIHSFIEHPEQERKILTYLDDVRG